MISASRRWITGILAILVGFWDGCGGLIQAIGALAPYQAPPSSPLLSAKQHNAMVEVMAASEAWDPVTGGLHALSALSGPLLVLVGIALLIGAAPAVPVARLGLLVGAGVNVLHGLWSGIWYLLLWGPWLRYLETALPSGSRRDLSESALDAVMTTSLAVVIGLSLGWFLVKAAILVAGVWALRGPGPDSAERPPEPKVSEPGLDWAP